MCALVKAEHRFDIVWVTRNIVIILLSQQVIVEHPKDIRYAVEELFCGAGVGDIFH